MFKLIQNDIFESTTKKGWGDINFLQVCNQSNDITTTAGEEKIKRDLSEVNRPIEVVWISVGSVPSLVPLQQHNFIIKQSTEVKIVLAIFH